MSELIRHIACDACGSSDGNALYDDGHTYCFVCLKWTPGDGEADPDDEVSQEQLKLVPGSFMDIPNRKIREETCRKYGYMVNRDLKVHVANYRTKPGPPDAQKVRDKDKNFKVTGNAKAMGFFGQHLWPTGGKRILITEGELDALSFAEALNCKYPVVSLPNGAQAAKKAIKNGYDYLLQFDEILLSFDMDEHGQKVIEECAGVLPPGRVKIVQLPHKDANEVLLKEGPGPLIRAFWDAQIWRPDGIISGDEITLESLQEVTAKGYSIPFPKLNDKLMGLRKREITLLTAGSGIGKSTFARELAYHLHQNHGLTIGNMYLEESKEKTAQGYIAIDNNVPLGKLRADPTLLTEEEWRFSLKNVIQTRMFFYDHFGSLDSERLLQKLRYMVTVLGCDFIILDHISIVISGQKSSTEGERRDIDMLMTALRSLVEETGVGIIAIVHLNTPEGKPHEEGGRVTLKNLRGSGALKQLSDNVVALERDQQDEESSNQSLIRLLKNREHGDLGPADLLSYMVETGRMALAAEAFPDM